MRTDGNGFQKGIFKEEKAMSQMSSIAGTYGTEYQSRTEQTKKKQQNAAVERMDRNYGRVIGEPELSDTAKEYYEKLKKKYSNMDFILVSPEMKQQAEAKKGSYLSSKELLVLIDSDKIEKMATDENYRRKYESILDSAMVQTQQMKKDLGSNAGAVTSFGMTFDDKGNASFFAVVDKSLAAQKERITEKKAEVAEEKKAEAKKEAKEAKNKRGGKDSEVTTLTASSWQELLQKIQETLASDGTGKTLTVAERALGQSIDYTV